MQEVRFFVASSVVEFQEERKKLGEYILSLNKEIYQNQGVRLKWAAPENMSRAMELAGLQAKYDAAIRESRLFFLVAGKGVGRYTEHEFDVAWDQFCKTGEYPKIFTWFLPSAGQELPESVQMFQNRLRAMDHYTDTFSDWDALVVALTQEIKRELPTEVPEEQDAEMSLNRLAERIRKNNKEADSLARPVLTWVSIPRIVSLYEDNFRLVRKFHVEPDAVYWYADFLWKQHLYSRAIEKLEWLEKLYSLEEQDPDMCADRKNLLGLCLFETGDYEKAETAYREALDIRQKLTQNPSEDNPYISESNLADTYGNLANLLLMTERPKEALQYLQKTLEIRKRLAEMDTPYSSEFKARLARAYNSFGLLMVNLRELDQAEAFFRQSLLVYAMIEDEERVKFAQESVLAVSNLAGVFLKNGKEDAAEFLLEKSMDMRRVMKDTNPEANEKHFADNCFSLGSLMFHRQQKKDAEAQYRKALDIYHRLEKDNPGAVRKELADTCFFLGKITNETDRTEEAEAFFQEALKSYRVLEHSRSDIMPGRAEACCHLGTIMNQTERYEKAAELFREALGIYRALVTDDSSAYRADLARTCSELSDLMERDGKWKETEALRRESLAYSRQLARSDSHFLHSVQFVNRRLAQLMLSTGRMENAEPFYRDALYVTRRLMQEDSSAFEQDLAVLSNDLGFLLYHLDRMEEGQEYCREAVGIYRSLVKKDPNQYSTLVTVYSNLALILENLNHLEEAEGFLREALDILTSLSADNNEPFLPAIAFCYTRIAEVCNAAKRPEKEEQAYQKALEIHSKLAQDNSGAFLSDVAGDYQNLGVLSYSAGRMEDAERCYGYALEIWCNLAEVNPGKYDDELADCSWNVGLLLMDTGRKEDAQILFQTAQVLCERSPGRMEKADAIRSYVEEHFPPS